MSATLPNLSDLSLWLDAALFTTSYRPVSLSTYICYDKTIFSPVASSTAGDSSAPICKLLLVDEFNFTMLKPSIYRS